MVPGKVHHQEKIPRKVFHERRTSDNLGPVRGHILMIIMVTEAVLLSVMLLTWLCVFSLQMGGLQ